jgi:hypothetical protein
MNQINEFDLIRNKRKVKLGIKKRDLQGDMYRLSPRMNVYFPKDRQASIIEAMFDVFNLISIKAPLTEDYILERWRWNPKLTRIKKIIKDILAIHKIVMEEDGTLTILDGTEFIMTDRKRFLTGYRLRGFHRFMHIWGPYFGEKKHVADAWLDIVGYDDELLEKILEEAKYQAEFVRETALRMNEKVIDAYKWLRKSGYAPAPKS